MDISPARSCNRCGEPAAFLVAGGDQTQAPGRLLVYCERCRSNAGAQLVLSIPLAVLDRDPDGLLAGLYRAGVTRTMPDGVRDVVCVADGTWSDVARALISADGHSGVTEVSEPSLDLARATSPFARAIHAKAVALRYGTHSSVHQQRLRESITVDLRKCSDVLTPDLVPPAVSSGAASAAGPMGVDLFKETWHTQKKFDPDRSIFHFEHVHPVGQIRTRCLDAGTVPEIIELIRDLLQVAWITKVEDKRLRALGFSSKRPDPPAAYAAAGIVLLATPDLPQGKPG